MKSRIIHPHQERIKPTDLCILGAMLLFFKELAQKPWFKNLFREARKAVPTYDQP